MKKRWLSALIVLMTGMALLSASVMDTNSQKIHAIDSPVYKAIKYLYIEQGLALPSTTGPWSEAELELMLSRIDADSLGEDSKAVYSYAEGELNAGAKLEIGIMASNVSLYTDTDFRAHTNPEDFQDPDMWGGKGDWYDPAAFLRVPIEVWMGPSAYAYFDLDLLKNPRRMSFDAGHSAADNYFTTSIPFLTPHTASRWDISWDFPYRAFGSIGGSWWNVAIGRDKLSWGPGETGNFAVGDQLPFHDNFRASAFSDTFKYTFSVSSFFHPENYYRTVTDDKGNFVRHELDLGYDQSHIKKGLKLFIGHRLEWRIKDIVNMALTESIAYQNDTGASDLSVLNPFMLLHNLYIRSNSNSLLTLDIDVTPIDHLNIYGQLAVDEFNVPGEHGEQGPPMAIAGMLGVKTGFALSGGMLYGTLEGAYTDPYLYLRDDGNKRPDRYGVDFIVANPVFSGRNGFTIDPIGYRYGGDAAVGSLKAGYEKFGKWNVEGNVTYIAHGCFDLTTKWKQVSHGEAFHGPTTAHPNGNFAGDDAKDRNAVSHTVILSAEGGYTILKGLDVYGGMTYVNIQNWKNMKGQKTDDFQFTLGLRYVL